MLFRSLVITGPAAQSTITVGEHALREGVLLGRYARCDNGASDHADSLSRVHALLLQTDDRLLVIDTASTFGTRMASGLDARVFELIGPTELELGLDTRVLWRWLS